MREILFGLASLVLLLQATAAAAGSADRLPPYLRFSPEIRVNVDSGLGLNHPYVAVAALASGAVAAAWEKPRVTQGSSAFFGSELRLRILGSDGSPRGGELLIAGGDDEVARYPTLAALAPDRLIAVWQNVTRESEAAIRGRFLDGEGKPLGPSFAVTPEGAASPYAPAVAVYLDGGFVVTWEAAGSERGSRALFVRHFAASGEPLDEAALVCDSCQAGKLAPTLASSPVDGSVLVVWPGDPQGQGALHARHFGPHGAAGPELTIASRESGESLLLPAAAALPDGGFVVAWLRREASRTAVVVRRLDSGGRPAASPLMVRALAPGDLSPPAVASGSEHWLVTWSERQGSRPRLRGRFVDGTTGRPLASALWLSEGDTTLVGQPALGLPARGVFVAVWWNGDVLERRLTLDARERQPRTASEVACEEKRLAAILGRLRVDPVPGKSVSLVLAEDLSVWTMAISAGPRGEPERGATAALPAVAAPRPARRAYRLTLSGGTAVLTQRSEDVEGPRATVGEPRSLTPRTYSIPPPDCSGKLAADDRKMLEALAHDLLVEGAGSIYLISLYRGKGIDAFRADVYPLSENGESQGRLAIEADLVLDEGAQHLRIQSLPQCAPAEKEGCTLLVSPVRARLADMDETGLR